MIVGTHYSLDFMEIEQLEMLDNPDILMAYMQKIIKIAGLQSLGDPIIHRFEPFGITCLILLTQSHLAVHTWPEHRFMAVDLFTCGPPEQGDKACESLKQFIPCQHIAEHSLERRTTL